MSKISLLDPLPNPDGDETVVVVKAGRSLRASIGGLVGAAAAPVLDAANAFAASAAASAAQLGAVTTQGTYPAVAGSAGAVGGGANVSLVRKIPMVAGLFVGFSVHVAIDAVVNVYLATKNGSDQFTRVSGLMQVALTAGVNTFDDTSSIIAAWGVSPAAGQYLVVNVAVANAVTYNATGGEGFYFFSGIAGTNTPSTSGGAANLLRFGWAISTGSRADIIRSRWSDAETVAAAPTVASGLALLGGPVHGLGYPGVPPTGSGAGANIYVFANPRPTAGTIARVRMWGGITGGTIKVRRFLRSGSALTQIGSEVPVVIDANQYNVKSVNLPYKAGECIGFYAPGGTVVFDVSTGDDGGYLDSGGADVLAFTDAAATTTNRLHIGFDVLDQYVTAPLLQSLQQTVSDYSAIVDAVGGLSATGTIGRPVTAPPVGGANAAAGTFVMADPVPAGATGISGIRLKGGTGGGTINVRVFDRSGNVLTQSGADIPVVVGAGVNIEAALLGAIRAGQYVGFQCPSATAQYTAGAAADGLGWYQAPTADSHGFTLGTLQTTARLEIGFDYQFITKASVASLKNRTANAELALKLAGINIVEPYIVTDGNSITATPGANGVTSWPDPTRAFLACTVVNIAVSGQTTATMTADIATQIGAHVTAAAAAGKRLIVAVLEGYNSMRNGGRTPVQAVDDLQAYCVALRGAAPLATICVANCPAMGGFNGNWVQGVTQAAYNANLASRYASFADVLIDTAGDPRLQDCTNATYYQAVDQTHLTNAGQLVLKDLMLVGIRNATQKIL